MKVFRIVLILLFVALLLAGCHSQVRVPYSDDAVLVYKLRDMDVQVQLTEEEAKMVAELFNSKSAERWFDYDTWELRYMEYGCPYDDNVYIDMGGTVCYIGYDGCGSVRIGEGGNVPHITLSEEEEQMICDLFRKYTGLEHPY